MRNSLKVLTRKVNKIGAYVKTLKDTSGNTIYPQTQANIVALTGYKKNESGDISEHDNVNKALSKLEHKIENISVTDTDVSVSPDVATAMGLTGDPQVKDALEKLTAAVNPLQYVWEKNSIAILDAATNAFNVKFASQSSTATIYYSDGVDYKNGSIRLSEPVQTISVSYNTYDSYDLTGKYAYSEQDTTILHLKAKFRRWSSGADYYVSVDNSRRIAVEFTPITELSSYNPNSFPIDDTQNGFYYKYIGRPQYIGARIATGSYTGTGTFGSSNKNSLTLDFPPKRISIINSTGIVFGELVIKGSTVYGYSYSGAYVALTGSINGNTISWYAADAAKQLNASGVNYLFVTEG